ncbi:doublecortin domain-containing protein 2 [Limosa lapponica baueri]|uniref:Doublecortin domain-containing protein 2 n=1 Tax=Limosa lapponica baueri TaxID=1758121 RepID=A0A2I0TCG8_LIMLA|nr:doublecortin domain-containing protein 2 [Limosa lapponica baueri]
MIGFKTLKEVEMANKKIKILKFRRVDFGLFGKLVGRSLSKAAPKCRGTQEIWFISKGIFLKAQELSPCTRKETGLAGGWFEQRTPDLILKEAECACHPTEGSLGGEWLYGSDQQVYLISCYFSEDAKKTGCTKGPIGVTWPGPQRPAETVDEEENAEEENDRGEEVYKGEDCPHVNGEESGKTVKERSLVEENKKKLNENDEDEAEETENVDQAEEELIHLNGKKNEENGEGIEPLNYQGDLQPEEEIKEEDFDSQKQKLEKTVEINKMFKARDFSRFKSKYAINLGDMVTCCWLRLRHAARKN